MDNEPMWVADRVVALTPSSSITIPETANEFSIKAGCIFSYKTPNQAYQLLEDKVLLKLDWAKNKKTKSSLKKTVAFADEGNSNLETEKIMARMDAMTIKMDAQYKELQSRAKQPTPDLDDDDIHSNRDNWRSSKRNDYNRDYCRSNTDDKSYDLQRQFNDFMKSQQSTNAFAREPFMDLKTQLEIVAKNHQASIQNLKTKFDRLAGKQSGRPSGSLPSNTQPNPRGNNSKSYQPSQSRNEHANFVFTKSGKSYDPPDNPNDKQNNSENFDSDDKNDEPTPQPPKPKQLNLGVGTERITFNIDSAIKNSYSNDDTYFSIDVINEILEEDFDAFLDKGIKILHSIERTVLKKEIFSEFNKFVAMTADENCDSESNIEEPPFKKITINTDYKIKTTLEEPPTDLELKPLPDNLEYVFLEEPSFLLVIISSQLFAQNKSKLVSVLKNTRKH
uniref:Reverse transcriptase domain-containing protein n=1 Tax=Tanacetum cinerariifolium TaxID=118510 RepID=A0A699H6F0_TANCI|nr:hypothetical protein [Tanacetum cinerariifolium]